MARGHHLRRGISMAGAAEESLGRRDDGSCHHQFSARRVDRVEGSVEFLVTGLSFEAGKISGGFVLLAAVPAV